MFPLLANNSGPYYWCPFCLPSSAHCPTSALSILLHDSFTPTRHRLYFFRPVLDSTSSPSTTLCYSGKPTTPPFPVYDNLRQFPVRFSRAKLHEHGAPTPARFVENSSAEGYRSYQLRETAVVRLEQAVGNMAQHNGTNGVHANGNGTNGSNGRNSNGRTMSRRASSPMMPAFMVSAPGKVIVFGEHAVVHGKVSTKFRYPLALYAQHVI